MEVCCLERASPSDIPKRYDCIPLSKTNEVSIGRGNDVTVQILAKDDPLMLSRKHAIIRFHDDSKKWVIIDNKSLNGIYVNHVKISKCEIKEGDNIHLGMPSKATNGSDFIFKFTKKELSKSEVETINNRLNPRSRTNKNKYSTGDKRKCEFSESKDNATDNLQSVNELPGTSGNIERFKRAKVEAEEAAKRLEDEKKAAEQKAKEAEERLKEVMENLSKEKKTVKAKYLEEMRLKECKLMEELQAERERLELEKKEMEEQMNEKFNVEMKEKESNLIERLKTQHEELMNEKKKIQCQMKKEMEDKLSEKEQNIVQLHKNMQEKLEKEIQEKEREMMEELKRQKENLLKEKTSVEAELQKEWKRKMEERDQNQQMAQEEMRKNLETKIKEKEEQMLKQLTMQKEQLLAEKKTVEESLQKEMERKLDEKNKDLQGKLEEEKQKLETVISKKHQEYETLQAELLKSRREQENQQVNFELAKQQTIEKVSDVMESELQCSICSELFIQATTLNCSHSFCHSCIMEWFKKKKECPFCRKSVTTYTHSLVLDNYIDKMVETLSEELKTRRSEIVKERKNKPGVLPASGTMKEVIILTDNEDSEYDEEESENSDDEWSEEYRNDIRFNPYDEYRISRDWDGDRMVSESDGNFRPGELCDRCGKNGIPASGTMKEAGIITGDEEDSEDENSEGENANYWDPDSEDSEWHSYYRNDDRFDPSDDYEVTAIGKTEVAATSGTIQETVVISSDEEEEVTGRRTAPSNPRRPHVQRTRHSSGDFERYYRNDRRFRTTDVYRHCRDMNGFHIVSGANGVYLPNQKCDRCDQFGHAVRNCPRTYRVR